jgi:AcrR family transcriptional regulator
VATRATGERPRTPLSRERILRAAVALADAEGIDSLTMRGLASQLQVEAMSLYNHVANKDDLLDGMLDLDRRARSRTADGTPTGGPRSVERAISAHDALLRHPWASMLWASRMNVGPARMRHLDAMLRDLREAGFSPGLLDSPSTPCRTTSWVTRCSCRASPSTPPTSRR